MNQSIVCAYGTMDEMADDCMAMVWRSVMVDRVDLKNSIFGLLAPTMVYLLLG